MKYYNLVFIIFVSLAVSANAQHTIHLDRSISVSVFKKPSVKSKTLVNLKGDTLFVLAIFQTPGKYEKWFKVSIPATHKFGWIPTSYVIYDDNYYDVLKDLSSR